MRFREEVEKGKVLERKKGKRVELKKSRSKVCVKLAVELDRRSCYRVLPFRPTKISINTQVRSISTSLTLKKEGRRLTLF